MYDPTKDPYLGISPDETHEAMMKKIGQVIVRFDGPPESIPGRFIEVERDGASINAGEWTQDGDDYLLSLENILRDVRIHAFEAAMNVASMVSSHAGFAIENELLKHETS